MKHQATFHSALIPSLERNVWKRYYDGRFFSRAGYEKRREGKEGKVREWKARQRQPATEKMVWHEEEREKRESV